MKNTPIISRKTFLRSLQSTPPLKRGRVVPLPSTALEAIEYGDPARVLERREFIGFGCGACKHHRRKSDRSAFHCDIDIGLWPEGTNKTCRRFSRRRKTDER